MCCEHYTMSPSIAMAEGETSNFLRCICKPGPYFCFSSRLPAQHPPDTFAGVRTALQQVSTPSLHKSGAMLVPKGDGSCGMGRLQVTHDCCANHSALVYGVCKVTVNCQPGDDCFLLITGISFFKPDEEVRKANDRAPGTAFNFFGCLTSTD